eukprot:jgi/Tetstr1/448841/TSEL_036067.t1
MAATTYLHTAPAARAAPGGAAHASAQVARRGIRALSPYRTPKSAAVRAVSTHVKASHESQEVPRPDGAHLTRRTMLQVAALAPQLASAARADEVPLTVVSDGTDDFSIAIPKDWSSGEGNLEAANAMAASRRALAWFPGGNPEPVNITLVITNSSPDFTKLGSFGTAEDFGTNLVNSMDRSYLKRAPKWARRDVKDEDIQTAHLIKTGTLKDSYKIEYTVQNANVQKYLFSLVSLGFNGRYNRVYTITAQCPEAQADEFRALFEAVFKSFTFPAVKY